MCRGGASERGGASDTGSLGGTVVRRCGGLASSPWFFRPSGTSFSRRGLPSTGVLGCFPAPLPGLRLAMIFRGATPPVAPPRRIAPGTFRRIQHPATGTRGRLRSTPFQVVMLNFVRAVRRTFARGEACDSRGRFTCVNHDSGFNRDGLLHHKGISDCDERRVHPAEGDASAVVRVLER